MYMLDSFGLSLLALCRLFLLCLYNLVRGSTFIKEKAEHTRESALLLGLLAYLVILV
jgi:hypothetical protein